MPETRAISNTSPESAMPFVSATFGAGFFWRQWYAFGYYLYPGHTQESGAENTV